MSEQQAQQGHLPPDMLAALLQTVRRRQQQGDQVGARVVLRALAAQQHNDPRIWLALATVAATRDEQRQAIEQAILLDPENTLAQRALERLNANDAGAPSSARATPSSRASAAITPALGIDTATYHARQTDAQAMAAATTPAFGTEEVAAITPAPALTPLPDAERARTIRWPLYVIIGVAAAVVLIVAAMLRAGAPSTAKAPTPTLALPGAVGVPPTEAATAAPLPTSAIGAAPLATTAPNRTPDRAPSAALPSATARPSPTVPSPTVPSPTPPVLVPGQIMVQGLWHASLLRPEHAVLLDGAIGTLQPSGRFVLALVAIGNDSTMPARIPADLFTLRDAAGNRYAPLAAASTTYLNTYGRGQRGDLSLQEEIPPGGGIVSVPLLFDVPSSMRSFTLHVGDEPLGWPISGTAALPATPTPS